LKKKRINLIKLKLKFYLSPVEKLLLSFSNGSSVYECEGNVSAIQVYLIQLEKENKKLSPSQLNSIYQLFLSIKTNSNYENVFNALCMLFAKLFEFK
jgi:hypothetical protein